MESIYEIIGRCIEQDNKRYFEELKEKIGHREAVVADFGMMPRIRELFCQQHGIAPRRLEARSYDRGAALARQLCIALLYACYCPNALNPRIAQRPVRNFKSRLCGALNISPKKIGTKTADALFAYGHCRSFRESVEGIHAAVARELQRDHRTASVPESCPGAGAGADAGAGAGAPQNPERKAASPRKNGIGAVPGKAPL